MKTNPIIESDLISCYAACERVNKRIHGGEYKYYIETYGCQMNVHDSEKLAGMLTECGYTKAESKEDADFILFNTCCVREHAELRTLGNVGFTKELKQRNHRLIIAVCGCMMQQEGVAEKLYKRFPFVDMVFGTHELVNFPLMLERALDEQRIIQVRCTDDDVVEGLPVKREPGFSTFVNIMYGCNNFCAYCIVPYVRGRERSRNPDLIISEINELVKTGYSEITLLGQNVNSYNFDGMRFPDLLERVNDIKGIERIRFMTSHPKDLSDELIRAMASLDRVCSHIHLPVQSGSNRILKLMNRRYSREHYFELLDKLRGAVKDVEITTDIIVGFPGETDDDYMQTVDLVKRADFSNAYTFAYSPRIGTSAAEMPDQVPIEVKKARLNELNAVLAVSIAENNRKYIGYLGEILIEGIDRRGEPLLFGKLPNFKMVYVPGDESLLGAIVPIAVDGFKFNSLLGHIRSGRSED